MELLFRNANILTMEPASPKAEALGIQFGEIFKIGKSEELKEIAGPGTRVIGLRDAICRNTARGWDFTPEECLTAEQALSLYTQEAAYFPFEEGERGTLHVGKAADLVVRDRDPLRTPPEAIPGIKVKMTVFGGRIVYHA